MREILEKKKQDYYKKTGKELKISEDEFFDMMRQELSSQARELKILLGLTASVFWGYSAAPPDDDDPLNKNRYKYFAKALGKIKNELDFYYNPLSFQSITQGSLFPSIGVLTKVTTVMNALGKETWGHVIGDQSTIDAAHPLKYILGMIPVSSQFDSEILPIIDPEGAKSLGIKSTSEARLFQ